MGRAFLPPVPCPLGGVRLSHLSLSIVGLSGRSRKFVRGSAVSAPRSFEVLSGTRGQLSDFISISLMHLFRKEECVGNAMASLAGSSRGAH
jgi:hypothetical protein